MSHDFPLPLADQHGEAAPDPWALPQQQPSTLIALWPGNSSPTKVEVIAALSEQTGEILKQIEELEGDSVLWNGVFKTAAIHNPLIIWAEAARPLEPGELNDATAEQCKWVIGLETLLSQANPFDEFVLLLRSAAAAFNSPAILDTVTGRWSRQQELTDLIASPPAEPPCEVLWTIHAVHDRDNNQNGSVWLHTHGLWRCGRPELDMLEIPASKAATAGHLMNEIAEISIESGLPPPGEPLVIGPNLQMAFQHWQAIAPQVDAINSGGLDDRQGDDNPHASVRAVICGPRPRGVFRKLWVWPEEAVERFSRDDAVVFRTQRATDRRAAMAQEYWGELATAFASMKELTPARVGAKRPITLLKAGIPVDDGDPEHREHLWFEAQRFEGEKARGELANQPLHITELVPGSVVDVHRDTVSDWLVLTAHGRFGPGDIPTMWRSIQKLRENQP